MATGKIRDIYPPGNNGTRPGAGRLTEDGTGKTFTFQTPGDLGDNVIISVGSVVNFDKGNGNSITNVRLALPTCTLSASAPNPAAGQPLTLSWTSENADSLSIAPGIGAVSPVSSGSVVIRVPSATTTYTITATSASGSATASVTVTPAAGETSGGGGTGGGPA